MGAKWTLKSLKEHFDALRDADQRAIEVLARSFEARMDNTNEWRNTVENQQNNFASKDDTERRLKMLEEARVAASSKQVGTSQLYGAAAAIVFVIASILGVVYTFLSGGR